MVLYENLDHGIFNMTAHCYGRLVRGILHSIADEVYQHLSDLVFVSSDPEICA